MTILKLNYNSTKECNALAFTSMHIEDTINSLNRTNDPTKYSEILQSLNEQKIKIDQQLELSKLRYERLNKKEG